MSTLANYIQLLAVIGPVLSVIIPALLFALPTLTPAVRSLFRPPVRSPATFYARAIRWVAGIGIPVHLALALVYLIWRPAAGVTLPSTPASDLDAFMRSAYNPWLDLVMDHFRGSGRPFFSGAMATINAAIATATLPDVIYVGAGLLLALLGFTGGRSEEPGLDERGSPGPWMRSFGWPITLLAVPGAMIGIALLPLFAETVGLPATVWATGWVLLVLLLGLLVSRGSVEPVESTDQLEATLPQPEETLDRLAWERHMYTAGFRLSRAVHGGGASALTIAGADDGDPGNPPGGRPRCEAFEPPPTTAEFLLLPGDIPSRAPWPHQVATVRAIRKAFASQEPQSVLLHTQRASGRTLAMLEAATETWTRALGRTLLLYPDFITARNAHSQFQLLLSETPRLSVHPSSVLLEDGELQEDAQIVFAAADLLGDRLLPSRVVTTQQLLADLGLIVFEDIEQFSGVRALNLSMVIRRMSRVLSQLGRQPVMAMTLCANPGDSTGALEYAQWLAGPFHIVDPRTSDKAPRKQVFAYLLETGPGRRDADGVDSLPPPAQLGWTTGAWGAPSHLARGSLVGAKDLTEPAWSTRAASTKGFAAVPPMAAFGDAYVHIKELSLPDVLTLESMLVHGGTCLGVVNGAQLHAHDHVAVLVPAMRRRAMVRWMARQFLRAHTGPSGPEPSVWDYDLRPLGPRLVKGHLPDQLIRRHLRAALAESPATREELVSLAAVDMSFSGSSGVALVDIELEQLRHEQAIEERRDRRFEPRTGEVILERRYALARESHTPIPLHTVTSRHVTLSRPGAGAKPLLRIDRCRLLHLAYPGRLFMVGDDRFRVDVTRFADAWALHLRDEDNPAIDVHCQTDQPVAFTEPIVSMSWQLVDRSYSAQQVRLAGALSTFSIWRGRFEVELTHHGYYECIECGDGGLIKGSHHWYSSTLGELKESSVSQALVIELPESYELAILISLRRMLATSLEALVWIDPHEIELDVLAAVPGAEDTPRGCILIRDPWGGGSGLLDALGASSDAFLRSLFRLTWLRADDLVRDGSDEKWAASDDADRGEGGLTWKDIGYAGMRKEDNEDADPDPASVRDIMTALLGDAARRYAPADTPQEAPGRAPDAGTHAPNSPEGYRRMDAMAVAPLVRRILGMSPSRQTAWQIADLHACWEWMHAHIAYRSDASLYGLPEYVASVTETLSNRAGDCEDHANLLGSLAMALGAKVRMVLTDSHALIQVDLEGRDSDETISNLLELIEARSASMGLSALSFPNQLGVVAPGWRRVGIADFERTEIRSDSVGSFYGHDDIRVQEDEDGRRYLALDTCMTRVMGSVDGLMRHGCLDSEGDWLDGTLFVD